MQNHEKGFSPFPMKLPINRELRERDNPRVYTTSMNYYSQNSQRTRASWMSSLKDKISLSTKWLGSFFSKSLDFWSQKPSSYKNLRLEGDKTNKNLIFYVQPKKRTLYRTEYPQRYSNPKCREESKRKATFLNVINYHKSIFISKMDGKLDIDDPKYIFHHANHDFKPQPRFMCNSIQANSQRTHPQSASQFNQSDEKLRFKRRRKNESVSKQKADMKNLTNIAKKPKEEENLLGFNLNVSIILLISYLNSMT